MTALTTAPRRGAAPTDVLRLHFSQRALLLRTPPGIMLVVFALTVIIAIIFWRVGSVPGSDEWVQNSRSNAAIFWALPGFFGWLGVQTVSLTFPLALSLGSTRRAFVAGTVLTHVVLSLYVTAMLLVLLAIELATGHWFFDIYMTDVWILGAGNPLQLAVTAFLGTLFVLSVGGAFAASWVRFGALGPMTLAAVSVISLGIVAIFLIPLAALFQPWWIALAAGVVIVLAVLAQYLFLRRASVR
ncbi:hypothetical protein [Microbacterium sp. RURRCA19A]|uniref:hypothetical protein n=1 Tax=Microbacterium sp. RURRCA19A TaxID=1907391 RepID=UPI0009543B72|nr:hypothetical protein [Microbacterium sp. RURRCA19A]SIS14106.1 hypothetical protein SAMN05880568_3018 [Microbacterium sp. RURRCA19A]